MTPILLSGETVKGFLPDATSCVVTEERNGIFELELTYPVAGPMFGELAVDRYIKAKPNDTANLQLFRIYEITKPIAGIVTVKGEHVSYALAHYPVTNVSGTGTAHQAVSAVLAKVNAYLSLSRQFSSMDTGWTAQKEFKYKVGSARAALGGSEGSLLDTFGGEYEWDNYTVKLHQHRGHDTGVVVAYRKNMTDLKVTTSLESAYTALFPYAIKDDVLVTLTEGTLPVQNASGIADRVLIRDFSSDFQNDETVTAAALKTKAQAYLNVNTINAPSMNATVSFIHLWQSPEYAELAALEKVSLCDWVTVRHDILGVDIKAQVIKTEYDCIAERYNKIELGSARANFQDTLQQTVSDVKNLLNNIDVDTSAVTAAYTQAIVQATALITSVPGGYVTIRSNANNKPTEIIVSDKADYTDSTAHVWRWNTNGIGYSSTGYAGPYTSAITSDNTIITGTITSGTINASVITAGVLQSANGESSFNLNSGLLTSNNIKVTGGTIKIGGSNYYTYIANGSLEQYLVSSGGLIGGLVPVGIANQPVAETLYYQTGQNGAGISERDSNGNFITIANFQTSEIKLYSDSLTYYYKHYIVRENRSVNFKCFCVDKDSFYLNYADTFNDWEHEYFYVDTSGLYYSTLEGSGYSQYTKQRIYITQSTASIDVDSRIQLLADMADYSGGYITIEKGQLELSDGTYYLTLDHLCENVLWKNDNISVNSICFNGGDTAFQIYNGELAFGIQAQPMAFWAQYYDFKGSDIRIQGTHLKDWIKANLTPKSGGGWV